jgi:hypothetical protein
MTLSQAMDTFSNYSRQEKIDFLVHFAHTLTILARDTYEVGGEGLTQPSRLRRMNEVQHRIMGVLLALMKQEVKRYPDDVFVQLLLEHPDDLGLQQQLQEAYGHLTIQIASTT